MKLHTVLIGFLTTITLCVSAHSGTTSVDLPVSKRFCPIIRKAKPAVVCIKTESKGDTDQAFEDLQRDFFRHFFPDPFKGGGEGYHQPRLGLGSGVLISPNGLIVTNAHVVKDSNKIEVILDDGQEKVAVLKGIDPYSDLAVIQIEGSDYPFLEWGDSDVLEIGEEVIAIGSSAGLQGSCTTGTISYLNRGVELTLSGNFIQTQTPITTGNSGGALLNMEGKVVGINVAIIVSPGAPIGLAIPSKLSQHVVEQLTTKGRVVRGYLGVVVQSVEKDTAKALKMKEVGGALVVSVEKNSPADKAGLKQGDILFVCNGKQIETPSDFRRTVSMMAPGSSIALEVYRKGQKILLNATLGEREDPQIAEGISQKLGILEVETLTPQTAKQLGYPPEEEGVLITKVKPGSSVDKVGFVPGYIIKSINGKDVNVVEEYKKILTEEASKEEKVVFCVVFSVRGQKFMKFYPFSIK